MNGLANTAGGRWRAITGFGRKVLAFALAAVLVAPMTGAQLAGQAFAADSDGGQQTATHTEEGLELHGVDFMNTSATDGLWDILRIDNAAATQNIYIEVEQGGRIIAPRFKYTVEASVDAENTEAYEGKHGTAQVAQIVALQLPAVDKDGTVIKEKASLEDVYADRAKAPSYTVKIYTAQRGGSLLYSGVIHPVYAKLVDEAAGTEEYKLLGIRTLDKDRDSFAETIGAGGAYYKEITGGSPIAFIADTGKGTEPKVVLEESEGQAACYCVTYTKTDGASINGAVKYVDMEGNIVRVDDVLGLEGPKDVDIEKSFFAYVDEVDENGNVVNDENGDPKQVLKYYRVIQRLTGTLVQLSLQQPTVQVRVMEVKATDAQSYRVTVNYVDENDKLLWSDSVDVKGEGYQYTLPNSFSISSLTKTPDAAVDPDKSSRAVNYYTLSSWSIATNSGENAAENADVSTQAVEESTESPVVSFTAGDYPNGRTVTATYVSQNVTKEVKLTVVEVNGQTGELIDEVSYTVTPEQAAVYTPAKKSNGLVPWEGNTEPIEYQWADLEKGNDVRQYVYYVPEDYVPAEAYDITVQYMNIANSQILRTETVKVDPEANQFVNILGEETFAVGNETYVRLDGQETGIRHAYFSPARTYTIYYRNVNDQLSASITVHRTQIIETERVEIIPGTTVLTAAPVAAEPTTVAGAPDAGAGAGAPGGAAGGGGAAAAAPVVDAGVSTGDGTTVINDDENPLANFAGQDTSTERTIVDDENPLYSGLAQDLETSGSNMTMRTAATVAAIVAVGVGVYWWQRRHKKAEQAPNNSTKA